MNKVTGEVIEFLSYSVIFYGKDFSVFSINMNA